MKKRLPVVMGIATLMVASNLAGQESRVKVHRGPGSSINENMFHLKHDISNRFSILGSQHHFGEGYPLNDSRFNDDLLNKEYPLNSNKSSMLTTSFLHIAGGHYHFKRLHSNKSWDNSSYWPGSCGNYSNMGASVVASYLEHYGGDANQNGVNVTGVFAFPGTYRFELHQFSTGHFGALDSGVETSDSYTLVGATVDDKMDYLATLAAKISINQDRVRTVIQYEPPVAGQFPKIDIYDFEFTGSYSMDNMNRTKYTLADPDINANLLGGKLVAADLYNGEVGALTFKVGARLTTIMVEPDVTGTKLVQKGGGYTTPPLFGSTQIGSADIEYLSNGKLAIVYELSDIGSNGGLFKLAFLNANGSKDNAFGAETIEMLTDGQHFIGMERTIDVSTTLDNNVLHIREQYQGQAGAPAPQGPPAALPGVAHIRVGSYNISGKEFTSIKRLDDIYDFPIPTMLNHASLASVGTAEAAVSGIDRTQFLQGYDNKSLSSGATYNYLITRFGFESTTAGNYTIDATDKFSGETVVTSQTQLNNLIGSANPVTIDGDLVLSGAYFGLNGRTLQFANDSRLILRDGAGLLADNVTFESMTGETFMRMWEGIQIENKYNTDLVLNNCTIRNAMVGVRNHLTTLHSQDNDGTKDGIVANSCNAGINITGCQFEDNYISCYLIGGAVSSATKKIENSTFTFSGNLADPSIFKYGEERFLAHLMLVNMTDKVTLKSNTFKGDTPEYSTVSSSAGNYRDNMTCGIWTENSVLEFESAMLYRNTFEKLSKGIYINGSNEDIKIYRGHFKDCYIAIDAHMSAHKLLHVRDNLVELVGSYTGLSKTFGAVIKPKGTLSLNGSSSTFESNHFKGLHVGIMATNYPWVLINSNGMEGIKLFGVRADNGALQMLNNLIVGETSYNASVGIYIDNGPGSNLSCNVLKEHYTGLHLVSPYDGVFHDFGSFSKNEFLNNSTGWVMSDLQSPFTQIGQTGLPCDNKWNGNAMDIAAYYSPYNIAAPGPPPPSAPLIEVYYNKNTDPLHEPVNVYASGYLLNTIQLQTGSWGGTCIPVILPEANKEMAERQLGIFDQVDELISLQKKEEALELNESIITNNRKEENEKWVNALFLNGFSKDNQQENDLIRLIGLAESCAGEEGPAVYKARVMLADYNPMYNTLIKDCQQNQEEQETVGIEQHRDIYGLRLFPNPASDIITVMFDEHDALDQVFNIYNARGQLVKSFEINDMQEEFGISDLDKGIYFYRLDGTGQIGRFVKN